jgi:hypothetical protein
VRRGLPTSGAESKPPESAAVAGSSSFTVITFVRWNGQREHLWSPVVSMT